MAINKKEYFSDSKEKPGELGAFIIIFFDKLLHMFTNLFNKILVIGIDLGLETIDEEQQINSKTIKLYKHGTIFNYIYLRYLVTILFPPLGVFISKGIYGWVNILMTLFFLLYTLFYWYNICFSYNI